MDRDMGIVPDKLHMETMAIGIISSTSLIVNMGNIVNMIMMAEIEAMANIDAIMTMID